MTNTPYVKQYENGTLLNPITKENPYLSGQGTSKGEKKERIYSNGKGRRMVVVNLGLGKFYKAFGFKTIGNKRESSIQWVEKVNREKKSN